MALTAGDITSNARTTLLDAAAVYWTDAELRRYLDEAIRATVAVKPDAYPVRGYQPLVAGTVQTIPADGVALTDITHNEVGGRVVTIVDLAMLQEANRFWPAATQQAQVEHFAIDARDPRRFMCFPPNDGAGSVFMIYGGTPAALTSAGATLPLLDIYDKALTAGVLARAYAKNSKRQDLSKATLYEQQWAQLVGARTQAQIAITPRVAEGGQA